MNMINTNLNENDKLVCNWPSLRSYLLTNWDNLSAKELDMVGPSCKQIAYLLDKKYGLKGVMAENYLRGIERILPLSGQ